MLQAIRDRLTGWVLIIMLAIIGIAMAMWGVDFSSTGPGYVAKITHGWRAKSEISSNNLQRGYSQMLARYQQAFPDGVPEMLLSQLKQELVESAILDELMNYRAVRAGFRITDEFLHEQITSNDNFFVDGKFSQARYESILRNQGESPVSAEIRLRRGLRRVQLEDGILRSSFILPAEAKRRVALEDERREVAYLKVKASDFAEKIEINDDEINTYYDANPKRFVNPEAVDLAVVHLVSSDLVGDVEISEQQVRDYYDQLSQTDPTRFSTPEKRQARHILVKVPVDADEVAMVEAEAKAQRLLDRLDAGEDFATLAKSESEDAGSANAGGDLGWAARTAFVGPFADAVFSMDVGEQRGPVKSRFGWHVIQLDGIQPEDAKPYDQVRYDLETQLREEMASAQFYDAATRLDELAFESPDSLLPAAEALGLSVQTLSGVTRASGEGLAAYPAVREAAFSDSVMHDRENSRALELDDGSVAVVRIIDVYPAHPQSLDEVREIIVGELTQQKAQNQALAEADKLLQQAKEGASLADLGVSSVAERTDYEWIERQDAELPSSLTTAVYEAGRATPEAPAYGVVQTTADEVAVYKVRNTQPGAGVSAAARLQLAQRLGAQELNAYHASVRERAEVSVYLDRFE